MGSRSRARLRTSLSLPVTAGMLRRLSGKERACQAGDARSSPGEGNGSPTESPTGRGAWRAAATGVATQADADTSEERVTQGVQGRGRVPGRKCGPLQGGSAAHFRPRARRRLWRPGAARVPGSAGGEGAPSAWFHPGRRSRVRQAYREARAGGAFDPRASAALARAASLRSRLPRKCFPSVPVSPGLPAHG